MTSTLSDFPFFSHNPETIYLDNASTTQKPQWVIDRVNDYISHDYSNIHRWQYESAERSEELYHISKVLTAQHLWYKPSEIIYGHNATHCSNIIAQALCFSWMVKKWQTVVLWQWDHHSGRVVRQRLQEHFCFNIISLPLTKDDDIDWQARETIKTSHEIAVIHLSHVSNVTWTIYDVQKIFSQCREQHNETFCLLDASQSVAHIPIQHLADYCDAVYFTWHKMLAYTGIWVLALKKKRIKKLNPLFWWWSMVESVSKTEHTLVSTKEKFEPWTPNLIGAVSLLAAREYLDTLGWKNIQQHEQQLTQAYLSLFLEYQKKWLLTLYGRHESKDRLWVFSFLIHWLSPLETGEYFSKHNIAIRVWWHCAHPLVSTYNKTWVCRLSTYVYNTIEEVEKVREVLLQITQ